MVKSKVIHALQSLASRKGGIFRTSEALSIGVQPRDLYGLRDSGEIEQISRGTFRLLDSEPLTDPDLVTVGVRVSGGVICLISALSFHGITTQIPHKIDIALIRGAEPPRLEHPPINLYWFSAESHCTGIEEHKINGIAVKVYSAEKTLADCFKFRNKIGMDIVLEALKLYRERKKPNWDVVMQYARVCRVEKVIRPYIEAIS